MKKYALILPLLAFPALAFAAPFTGLSGFITAAGDLIRQATTVVAGLALLVFFWGLVKFIRSVSETGKTEGRTFMIWGIVALFVMMSVWGIIGFMQRELGLPDTSAPSTLNATYNNTLAPYPGAVSPDSTGAVGYPTPSLGGWRNLPRF